jgi:hypothetical protein
MLKNWEHSFGQTEARTANRRLAQWRVSWIIEHSTLHQILWCIDSFVLGIRHYAKPQNVSDYFKEKI